MLILIFLLIRIQVKAQVGMVVPFLGTNCPSGYLKMDQERGLGTEEYPALFTQAGYTHGGGVVHSPYQILAESISEPQVIQP